MNDTLTDSSGDLILVVDDDADMRLLLHHFLKGSGFRALLAEDGLQALRLIQEHQVGLILMDASMPGMGGFEVTRRLCAANPTGQIPVIMVTALADEHSVNEAFTSGAEEYITKPINWAVLRHRIASLLRRHRLEKRLRESEDRFRSMIHSSTSAIVSTDAEDRILLWNAGAEVAFGYTEAEILFRPVSTLMPERFRDAHARNRRQVLLGSQMRLAGMSMELVGLRKSGEEFPLEVTLSTWESAGQRYFASIMRDISKRKRLEQERERAMQNRMAISAILETSLESLSLTRQLEVALNIIHTLPWLAVDARGGIFLADDQAKVLTLVVQKMCGDGGAFRGCTQVPYGACLCGQAAVSRKIIHAGWEDQRHDRRFIGARPHGHYCVPIQFQQRLLGVLNVFLPDGHAFSHEEEGVLHTVAQTLATIIERRKMEEVLEHTNRALKETRLEIIHRLGMAAEFRDNETGMHIIRMSHYAALLARAAGMNEERCDILLNAAPMHDVGKIGITDAILLKRGRLTEGEFAAMKTHTTIGAHMLFGHNEEPLKMAHVIALTHHERWDGSGYPHGLSGEQIPLEGRICAVADVFDALTSVRPYKEAWSVSQAVAELRRCSGTHFEPRLISLFQEILPEIIQIRERFADGAPPERPTTTCPAPPATAR
ncbi:MAG: response regulator [Magnetococcales bacterium]|nr:response regulator [Magnetococcales bacterium]